jgi:multicomponent K+:H+ antiporter subunit E
MRNWIPFPVVSFALAAAWLALAGISPAQILLAAVLALAIPRATAVFLAGLPAVGAPATAMRLALVVIGDIVLANITVARLVLGAPARLRPEFVEVPLTLTHPHAIALLASIITMTPGTVSAALAPDSRSLLVHALDCEDPARLVEHIKHRYERPLVEILEC